MVLGIIGAVGSALVYWVGGYLTIEGAFTIGTIVAFGAYLGQLYGPLMALTNAPVEFAQSMVSFERVFEVLDIPFEIAEAPDARPLERVEGRITFDHVTFDYTALTDGQRAGLAEVAVSYTHLDVYKRQVLRHHLRRSGQLPAAPDEPGGAAVLLP